MELLVLLNLSDDSFKLVFTRVIILTPKLPTNKYDNLNQRWDNTSSRLLPVVPRTPYNYFDYK